MTQDPDRELTPAECDVVDQFAGIALAALMRNPDIEIGSEKDCELAYDIAYRMFRARDAFRYFYGPGSLDELMPAPKRKRAAK